ncbi:2485_t:CDS:2 [Diversispora eburnea]|uniref:2485_t:CDS:1 n=1 Tax=Diversispora eburnea TaxID=1213867 RepID=A0A9N9FCC4_9GLOM|nr:2485_t:CDS:2 [Diversispora eburnea]
MLCPEIKVGTLLCNSYYCAIKTKEYHRLVDNSKSVEELKIEIQELKTQYLQNRDQNLCGFFDLIFQSMNPKTEGLKTKEALKQKVMLLRYQMAALSNKQVGGRKNVIGLYMASNCPAIGDAKNAFRWSDNSVSKI